MIILRAIAIVVGLAGVQHGVQALLGLRPGGEPPALTAEHVIVCLTGLAAAYGLWQRARWGPWMLAVSGALTAVLVVSLGPLLALESASRGGLWVGGVSIATLTGIAVWYAQRKVHVSAAA